MTHRPAVANMRRPSAVGLPGSFAPWELAQQRGVLSGTVGAGSFARGGVDTGGGLAVEIRGVVDDGGIRWIRMRLNGEVSAVCQRCLEPVSLDIDRLTDLRLSLKGGHRDQQMPEEELRLEDAESRIDTLELIEDEVILTLPIAPMHPVGHCAPQGKVASAYDDDPTPREPPADSHPFALLRSLKKE